MEAPVCVVLDADSVEAPALLSSLDSTVEAVVSVPAVWTVIFFPKVTNNGIAINSAQRTMIPAVFNLLFIFLIYSCLVSLADVSWSSYILRIESD